MYLVVFVKQVWVRNESVPLQFYRDAVIPFVPFVGMEISVCAPELGRRTFGPITQVTWFEHKQAFFLQVADDSSMLEDPELTIELKTDFLETLGWISFDKKKKPDFWFSVEYPSDKVNVFSFECYDLQTDRMIRSKRQATRGAIALRNGVVLEETKQQVDISQLDEDGFLGKITS